MTYKVDRKTLRLVKDDPMANEILKAIEQKAEVMCCQVTYDGVSCEIEVRKFYGDRQKNIYYPRIKFKKDKETLEYEVAVDGTLQRYQTFIIDTKGRRTIRSSDLCQELGIILMKMPTARNTSFDKAFGVR